MSGQKQHTHSFNALAHPSTAATPMLFVPLSCSLPRTTCPRLPPSIQHYCLPSIAPPAIVPIYRLDTLTAAGLTLTLSRLNLALIYAGQLTWWNDSRLVADNPSVALPALRVTVVYHDEPLSINAILFPALTKFYANFTQYAVPSSIFGTAKPVWPLGRYAAHLAVAGPYAAAATVTATNGAIGYAALALALDMRSSVANMINQAGSIVAATSESVTFTTVELGIQSQSRTTLAMDLTDPTGSGAWPICGMSYLLIDTVNTASTCSARQAVVDFWLWFYQSTVVSSLITTRQYARVPDIVMSSLNVLAGLETGILCRGSAAYTATITPARALSVPSSVSFLSQLITPLFVDPESVSVWSATEVTDQLAFDQLVNAEVDIAMFDPNIVDATRLQEARDSGDFLILPTFMYAMSWTYNPQITSTVNIASYMLRLDFRTIAMIILSCITVSFTTQTDTQHVGLRVCRSLFSRVVLPMHAFAV